MRTINDIKKEIQVSWMNNEKLAEFYGYEVGAEFSRTFSQVSLEAIMIYIFSAASYVIETLHVKHVEDTEAKLDTRLTHNKAWYSSQSREFQLGNDLDPLTGRYEDIDIDAMIVANAATDEKGGKLIIKIAKDGLQPLSSSELEAFISYINKIKDAGVLIDVISDVGDSLRMTIDIWYDALVIDSTGQALNGSGEPVKDAIDTYITNLPFNGEFQIAALEDILQSTPGVVIPNVIAAEYKYAANDWTVIDAKVKPNAGYMNILPANLTINYRQYAD